MAENGRWERVKDHFFVTIEFIAITLLDFVSVVTVFLSVKGLELMLHHIFTDGGPIYAKGTPYEFSAKMIFETAELGVMIALAVAIVAKGFKLWFWPK